MPTDPIIVALDYDEAEQALQLVAQIKDYLRFFKVGSQLFTREGPAFIRQLRHLGVDVFLDLKFHDIPETVRKAVRAAAALDVRFLTIHASGGPAMIEAALKGAEGTSTTVLGVTVLTSMDEASLRATGQERTPGEQVLLLAAMAQKAGLKGLVCSPLEIAPIRERLGRDLLLVTPGIRGVADRKGDQKRTLSAEEALRLGADHLVIGRPITEADDPAAAAAALAAAIPASAQK